MKQKPTRTFVYITLTMVFLFVIGLLVVGMLVANDSRPSSRDLTADSSMPVNETTVAQLHQTQTYVVEIATNLHGFEAPTGFFETQTAVSSIGTSTPIPYDASMSPTAVINFSPMPTLTPTLTFTPLAYSACSWQWARQPLPDVGMMALEAFIEAEMIEVSVRAEAYGENCIDGTTNTANYFAAMTTDFYVSTPIDNLTNADALVEQAIKIYNVLIGLAEDEFPAKLGYLDITFNPPGGPGKGLRAMFSEFKAALEAGLAGGELLEELGGLS
jgi:hypothetical protein